MFGSRSSSDIEHPAGTPPQRLSDLLLASQLITQAQLSEAREEAAKTGDFLCKVLVQLKYITQDDINACFVKICKIPHISLLDYNVGADVLRLIPQEICLKYGLLPIDKLGRILTVAMIDPLDPEAIETIEHHCPDLRIKPILCNWTHFEQVSRKYFGLSSEKKSDSSNSMESFGLSKLPPKPAPRPAPAPAPAVAHPPASAGAHAAAHGPSFDPAAITSAIQEGLRGLVQEISAQRTAPAVAESSPGLTADALAEAMRGVVRELAAQRPASPVQEGAPGITPEALAEALRGVVQELVAQRPAVVAAESTPGVTPEALGEVLRASVRDAMADALKQLERPAPVTAVSAPAAPGPTIDLSGLETAIRASLEDLKETIRSQARSLPATAPVAVETGAGSGAMAEAIQDLVNTIRNQTPAGEALGEIVRDSIGGTIQEAFAAVMVQLRASQKAEQPEMDLTPFAEMIRDTIGGVMQEAMATLIVQSRNSSAAADNSAAQQEALLAALRDSQAGVVSAMREAIDATRLAQESQGARLAELAEAAVQTTQQTTHLIEASLVQNERVNGLRKSKQARHASVAAFGGAQPDEGIDHSAEDERVLDALEAEVPLESLTFETFFPGKANSFTTQISQSVAGKPGGEYNPFFLYGHVGLGKTHLISAVGNHIRQQQPRQRVGYVSASHFSRRLKEALAADAQDAFRENYCHWDVLILDDIQFMGGRVEAQEEFFHIFNVLHQQGRQIIIASDKAPDRLGLLEQRLISRFSSGIVAELKPPEWETRMQILRHHVAAAKARIPEEVCSLIAMRVAGDVRKMVGSLRKVIAFAALSKEPITVEVAAEVLSHLGGEEAA